MDYGWTSNNGCNIDNDSKLRNARNLTNLREINQLLCKTIHESLIWEEVIGIM